MVYKPFDKRFKGPKYAIKMLLICVIFSLVWSIIPFTGWTEFRLDKAKLLCSIKMRAETSAQKAYLILGILFLSIIPSIVLAVLNIKTVRKVRFLIK